MLHAYLMELLIWALGLYANKQYTLAVPGIFSQWMCQWLQGLDGNKNLWMILK